ncbi:hypothetical protein BaRGS_00025482 [Batillaria attramentaria]|uniref:Uncharacterized protein n=1 Tax=Batillaria attramentaria TaxID=370345 RepID=A0ABD0K886_9CAEN
MMSKESIYRLASQWKSLQNDRNSLQQFQTAVQDFVGRLVAMETSFTRLAEETSKPEVVENEELAREFLDQFRVSTPFFVRDSSHALLTGSGGGWKAVSVVKKVVCVPQLLPLTPSGGNNSLLYEDHLQSVKFIMAKVGQAYQHPRTVHVAKYEVRAGRILPSRERFLPKCQTKRLAADTPYDQQVSGRCSKASLSGESSSKASLSGESSRQETGVWQQQKVSGSARRYSASPSLSRCLCGQK